MTTTALAEKPALNLTVVDAPDVTVPSSPHASRWGIRMSDVFAATADLPEEQKGAIRWLDHHARQQNKTIREIAAVLIDRNGSPYSENTVYKAMTGRHEAKLDNFVRAIQDYRKPFAERPAEDKIPYVPISLTVSIIDYCEKAKKYERMGLVFGRNQSGKSEAFRQLSIQHAPQQVQVFRVPTNGYLSQLVAYMCMEKKISTRHAMSDQKERLIRTFDKSMIIVLDEMHQCYTGRNKKPRLDTFEFGREIYDRTGATVIECATPTVQNEMENGTDALFFEQIKHRSLPPYLINPIVPGKDLDAFAEVLGLDPADGPALTLQTNTIAREGLGYWLMYLQCARGIAAKRKHKPSLVTWDDVLEADKIFNSMRKKK